eukprot:848975-Rhodomonas_salina.3
MGLGEWWWRTPHVKFLAFCTRTPRTSKPLLWEISCVIAVTTCWSKTLGHGGCTGGLCNCSACLCYSCCQVASSKLHVTDTGPSVCLTAVSHWEGAHTLEEGTLHQRTLWQERFPTPSRACGVLEVQARS